MISVDMIRRTIDNLHAEGIAALPYIQVSGDGDAKLLDPALYKDQVLLPRWQAVLFRVLRLRSS